MDLLSVIRRWRLRDKIPLREIERRTGLSRNTIRKYLRADNRKIARDIAGDRLTRLYNEAFPEPNGRWKVVAVTGSRTRLRDAIIDAATLALDWSSQQARDYGASDDKLIGALIDAGSRRMNAVSSAS